MKKIFLSFAGVAIALLTQPSFAALNVLTCEPEWAALATEIGGDKVKASSATTALQDPHRIEARPSLISKARNADLLACTGMELEVGWLPILLQQSGNEKIAAGKPGNFEAGQFIHPLNVPTSVDRRDGDVHAAGNPHIQQDPHNIAKIAEGMSKRLQKIDPDNAKYYQERLKDFSARWDTAIKKWEEQAASLKGVKVIEHHENMEYLAHWLGMHITGALEPKPGVDPSPAYLTQLLNDLKGQPVKMVLRAAYQDGRGSRWFADHAQVHAVAVPFTVGGTPQATDLFSLFDNTIQLLLEGAK
jgi:zinc/manganese transport system substrate-binding protein